MTTNAAASIRVGQVYASTNNRDRLQGQRQRRVVTAWDGQFVWLATVAENGYQHGPARVRVRRTLTGWTIPGHRLVKDRP